MKHITAILFFCIASLCGTAQSPKAPKDTSHLGLARYYYSIGEYEKASDNFDLYHQRYAEEYKKERGEALAQVEAKYENGKKEQQIAALYSLKKNRRKITLISIVVMIIAMGLSLFVLRANWLQKKLFAREKELHKKDLEKRMFELEQTALRAQMNPHFIFNSLNSVQRFVITNDGEGVDTYLSTFANLIRQTLENSGKQAIPLRDEIQYLDTYLKLEQMRGNGKFDYKIEVSQDVNTEQTFIPTMIIQPYLENSVIHGMAGKKPHEGLINLSISKSHKLTCVIEDNGVGIARSKLYKSDARPEHESMGTSITEKRIEVFNTVNDEKIELRIIDKSDLNAMDSGTKILINFPLHINN